MRRLGPNPDTLLCAAYGERKPLPFANAPLHFLTKSIRRRVFPAYVPLVIAESMCGNDVFTGCFSASAMAGKMLPRALQLLHLLWGQLVLPREWLGLIEPHWLVAVDTTT